MTNSNSIRCPACEFIMFHGRPSRASSSILLQTPIPQRHWYYIREQFVRHAASLTAYRCGLAEGP